MHFVLPGFAKKKNKTKKKKNKKKKKTLYHALKLEFYHITLHSFRKKKNIQDDLT